MSAAPRPPRPRALFVAALLLLTLALAGAIALQAYRNFLGHKATAERVLHDYARLAAARFANRTEMNFYYENFSPAMDALMRAKAGEPDVSLPAPRTIVGLEEDPRGLEPLYTADEDRAPLLPRPLTGGVAYDSLGSVIVTEADGRELYRSPTQYAPTFSARDSFEHPMMGAMRVQVALRPDLAPKLVIGGMPRSNLPMLLSLLALTAGLVVAALLQLRREYELSRLRADFVSGVSHELRTPLAQIRMFSETLLLGRVRSDDERERSLEIIDQEARRLTHLA